MTGGWWTCACSTGGWSSSATRFSWRSLPQYSSAWWSCCFSRPGWPEPISAPQLPFCSSHRWSRSDLVSRCSWSKRVSPRGPCASGPSCWRTRPRTRAGRARQGSALLLSAPHNRRYSDHASTSPRACVPSPRPGPRARDGARDGGCRGCRLEVDRTGRQWRRRRGRRRGHARGAERAPVRRDRGDRGRRAWRGADALYRWEGGLRAGDRTEDQHRAGSTGRHDAHRQGWPERNVRSHDLRRGRAA